MTDDVLAVIPARGGSKGIPRKNLRELGGKPLIAYQIETALAAERIDKVIVSTEDDEIASVASEYGAEIPFERPYELATDEVPVIYVYQHASEFYAERDDPFEYIVGLQPNSPFTKAETLDLSVKKLKGTGCDCVVSIAKITETHPFRSYTLENGRLQPLENVTVTEPNQRQDHPDVYGLTGAIIARQRSVLENWDGEDFALGDETRVVIQTDKAKIDIDTPFELKMARALCQYEENL